MIFTVCAIRDRAVDGFGQPIFVPHVGVAIRSFSDEVNRSDSTLHAHPEDYDLYKLGHYDDATGLLESESPMLLVLGKQVLRSVTSE